MNEWMNVLHVRSKKLLIEWNKASVVGECYVRHLDGHSAPAAPHRYYLALFLLFSKLPWRPFHPAYNNTLSLITCLSLFFHLTSYWPYNMRERNAGWIDGTITSPRLLLKSLRFVILFDFFIPPLLLLLLFTSSWWFSHFLDTAFLPLFNSIHNFYQFWSFSSRYSHSVRIKL